VTAQVLRRSLDGSTGLDAEEMLALFEQQVRYGPRHAGAAGHDRVKQFLSAELGGIAQEVSATPTAMTAHLYQSEPRRLAFAARYGDAAAVAVLVETARSLIDSPVPPRVGVDLVFFDGPESPLPATVLEGICGGGTPDSCRAEQLHAAAQRVLDAVK
jgi:hypothetical protein